MNKEYYLLDNGQPAGPFTFNELIQQSIDLDTQVSATVNGKWMAAIDVPELAGYFHAQGVAIVNEDSLASFWLRLAAYVLDLVVFFFLIMILAIIYASSVPNAKITEADVQKHRELIQLLGTLILTVYNAVLEATPLQGSVGKLLIGLQVVNEDGRRLTLGQALLRNIAKIASGLAFGFGYLYIFLNPYRQALHDKLAKTYIIRKPYTGR